MPNELRNDALVPNNFVRHQWSDVTIGQSTKPNGIPIKIPRKIIKRIFSIRSPSLKYQNPAKVIAIPVNE